MLMSGEERNDRQDPIANLCTSCSTDFAPSQPSTATAPASTNTSPVLRILTADAA